MKSQHRKAAEEKRKREEAFNANTDELQAVECELLLAEMYRAFKEAGLVLSTDENKEPWP